MGFRYIHIYIYYKHNDNDNNDNNNNNDDSVCIYLTHIAQKCNIFTFQHMGCSLDHNKETCHTTEVLLHERGGYMEGGHMEQRLNRAEAKLRAAFGA